MRILRQICIFLSHQTNSFVGTYQSFQMDLAMFPSSFVIILRSFFFIHVINFATTLNPEVTIPNENALFFYSSFIYNFTSDMRTFQPSDKFYFKKCHIHSLHQFTSVTTHSVLVPFLSQTKSSEAKITFSNYYDVKQA